VFDGDMETSGVRTGHPCPVVCPEAKDRYESLPASSVSSPLDQSPLLALALDDGCQYKRFDGNSDFVLPLLKLKPD
jgi:hypothetical protein